MAVANEVKGDLVVQGNVTYTGTLKPEITRSSLAQDTLAAFPIPFTLWRVHDALHTNLPGTAATDDLEITSGTIGTAPATIQTGDLKAAGATTRYARASIQLPAEYDDGQTVQLRFRAGMLTTVSDTTATLDVQAYEHDGDNTVSADICATAATTINSLTFADIDFTITETSLASGDWLDVRIAIAVNDAATVTAVIGCIDNAQLLCDIRG